jgi:hypothetical protein
MIKLENTEVYGWKAAIRGMRNPMNSWDKSDTLFDGNMFCMGDNDLKLMKRLAKAGSDHRKFLRMITVTVDITAPIYWVAEHDTYKIGTTRNSCSFMHRGTAKKFELSDFSFENSETERELRRTITKLNKLRTKYIETRDESVFRAIRQLLPSAYNVRYTWHANYEVLANIYFARRNHRLPEWRGFCNWILTLPYFEDIINAIDKA